MRLQAPYTDEQIDRLYENMLDWINERKKQAILGKDWLPAAIYQDLYGFVADMFYGLILEKYIEKEGIHESDLAENVPYDQRHFFSMMDRMYDEAVYQSDFPSGFRDSLENDF